jgi:hypothetical protein
MKAYSGVKVKLQAFITWQPMNGMLHPEEGTSIAHWTRTTTNPKLDLDLITKKIFPVLPGIDSILPSYECHFTDSRLGPMYQRTQTRKGKKQYFEKYDKYNN